VEGEPKPRGATGWDSNLALLLVLGAIWGAAFPVLRLGIVAGAASFPFAAVRWVLAAECVAVLAAASRTAWPDARTLVLSALFGGGVFVGGYATLLYWGEQSTSGGLSAVLVGTVLLASAALAYYLLPQERFSWRGSLGVCLGFVGVVLLFLPDLTGVSRGSFLGELAVVGAALSAAALGTALGIVAAAVVYFALLWLAPANE
jgi:drug/metabolite transporter (DMT)-like permease